MENLAPPYLFILILIQDLESGLSVRSAVKRFVETNQGEFVELLLLWLQSVERGNTHYFQLEKEKMNSIRRVLFDLLEFGLQGVSILEPLHLLEKELRLISEQHLDAHLGSLPFKLMIPLILFQFPALLILILGPLLMHLMQEVQ